MMSAGRVALAVSYPTPALSDATVRSAISGTPVRLETFASPPGTFEGARFEGHRVVTNIATTTLPLTVGLAQDDVGEADPPASGTAEASIRLFPGDTLLMRARTRSTWSWSRRADCLVATVPVGGVSGLGTASDRTVSLRNGGELHRLGLGLGPLARALADGLATNMVGREAFLASVAESYLLMLAHLFRSTAERNEATLLHNGPLRALLGTRFETLAPLFREARLRSVSVDELSRRADLNRSQFSRDFKAATGSTPSALLRAHSLHMAATLLRSTRMPLAEVALEAGYSDQPHMSRAVKAGFGLSPRQLRSQSVTNVQGDITDVQS